LKDLFIVEISFYYLNYLSDNLLKDNSSNGLIISVCKVYDIFSVGDLNFKLEIIGFVELKDFLFLLEIYLSIEIGLTSYYKKELSISSSYLISVSY